MTPTITPTPAPAKLKEFGFETVTAATIEPYADNGQSMGFALLVSGDFNVKGCSTEANRVQVASNPSRAKVEAYAKRHGITLNPNA